SRTLFTPSAERIRAALTQFVDEAVAAQQARRRLFREDAAQGLGLVQLAEARFDVVLMNPPFGDATEATHSLLQLDYPSSANDLFAVFVSRGLELLGS